MFDEHVIAAGRLRNAGVPPAGELVLELRSNWYRALPYSSLTAMTIALDGVEVPPADIRAVVDGTRLSLDDLAAITDRTWFPRDPLVVHALARRPLTAGVHDVAVRYEMRIADLVFGPHVVVEPACAARRLVLL